MRNRLLFLCMMALPVMADDGLKLMPVEYPLYEVDSVTRRIYYVKPAKYTMEHFMGALDIPTCFGIGTIPDFESAEQFAYYGSMFLEYRYHKTYGWYFEAGLDQHDHDYERQQFKDVDKNGNVLINTTDGTIFNMQLVAGGGYRIPLVHDIKGYYARPYVNKWNLGTLVQFGGAWSRAKFVNESAVEGENKYYELKDVHRFYPVLKFGISVEYFTSPMFSIFLSANYMQHLMRQPWDTPNMAGTLSLGIGFAGFFN